MNMVGRSNFVSGPKRLSMTLATTELNDVFTALVASI